MNRYLAGEDNESRVFKGERKEGWLRRALQVQQAASQTSVDCYLLVRDFSGRE